MESCCNENKEGKTSIDLKKSILWGVIAFLTLAVVYVLFFNGATSSVVPAAKAAAQTAGSYGGMVGGC